MKKKYFHGTNNIFSKPDLLHSRNMLDFGPGFYLTQSRDITKRWISTKDGDGYIQEYVFKSTSELKIYEFDADEEWLIFIAMNRQYPGFQTINEFNMEKYNDYDILIGPIADDRMYNSLLSFFDGTLTASEAIHNLTSINLNKQIVIKTTKALNQLDQIRQAKISPKEKQKYREIVKKERNEMMAKLFKPKEKTLEDTIKKAISQQKSHEGKEDL